MKAWNLTVALLVLGASFVCVAESPACRFRFRRHVSPCYSPPAPPKHPAARDTLDLRWKFQGNKPFFVEITTKTDQTMKVAGMDVTQKQRQTFFLRVTPEKKDGQGNWILGMKFVGIRMSIDLGGNKIDYDSTLPQPQNPLTDFFKTLNTLKFKVILAPTMNVSRMEEQTQFIRKIGRKNPQMEPLLQSILSDNAFKKMFEPIFSPIPQRQVGKGESWSRVSSLDLGPIGIYKTTSKYTYEGKQETLARIKVESRVSYSPPKDSGNLTFKIMGSSTLTTPQKPMPGVIFFDPFLGRVVHASLSMKLEGTLNIDIGGLITNAKLSQFQTTTVTVTDTNPVLEIRDKQR